MSDITSRTYADTDLSAVTALYNLADVAAGSYAGHVEEETRGFISSMINNVELDSMLMVAPDGTLVATGFVSTPPPGGHRIDSAGAVHPDWRGRGLGQQLLDWQLERAERIHRDVAPEAAWTVQVGAFDTDDRSIRLFERSGLKPVRYWFEMVAHTEGVPDLPVPEGLRVEAYRPEYAHQLFEAHMDAFADHWGFQRREEEKWRELTIDLDLFRPDLSRVVFDGDETVGYLLAYDDARPGWLYIGQVGTRRLWRGRGLASSLLSDVLRAGAASGKADVALGVDADSPTGAVAVYQRVGFTVEERFVTYSRPLG